MDNIHIVRNELKSNYKQITLIILLGLTSVISGAALMYVSGFLISKSSLKIGNILMLQVPTVLTRTFSLGQSVFSYLQRLVSHDLVLKIIEKMRSKTYSILEPMALKLKKEYKSGDLLSLISDDIEYLQNIYLKSIFPSIISLILYVIFITMISEYDVNYAILSMLYGLFIIFIVPFLSLIITKKHLKIMKVSKNKLYKEITSAIFGLTDLISANRVENFIEKYTEKEKLLLKKEHKIKILVHLRENIINFFAALTAISIVYFCKKMTINNNIENVYIASFCMIVLSILTVVSLTGDAVSHIPIYQESINRVKNFYKNEEKNKNKFIFENKEYERIIEVKNLSFKYDDKKIIKNISFSIKKGEKVAIIGKSGAGKSTIMKLLTGTYADYTGKIKIFGNNPNESMLGNKISMLNQKPYLFDMTIKGNIALSIINKNINNNNEINKKINDSLEKAHIKKLIDRLSDGIDTTVYETGARFSGGERQRLAFARTIVQNNELLFLDEPTVGLDPKTEHELIKTIFENSKDKTILWITHHLNLVESMDKVIFINDGEIEMIGNHYELYKNNDKYKKLYDLNEGF